MINLYEYQQKYLDGLPPRAIMAADTGVGKTFMALAHYDLYRVEGVPYPKKRPLLILAPASKVRAGDWEREIKEYFGEEEIDYEIYSYEKFSRNPTAKQFQKGARAIWRDYIGKDVAIIADECHRMKNPQSGIGKAMYAVGKDAKFLIGLSATPLPNGWIDFAGYSKIWGFTKGITDFKKRYCNMVDYKGFPEIIGYWHEDELMKQWHSISKRLTKAEALDLPSRTFKGVTFKRPKEYVNTILTRKNEKGEELDSAPSLAHSLRQTLTKEKMNYLADLVENTTENVVVFYNYISEREFLLEMLKQKRFENKIVFRQDGEKHELPPKEDWAGVKNSVTLAQYRSGSTGVEMTYGTVVVYLSPTYSYADYIQSVGRVYRNGQTEKTTFYNFVTPNSIEEDIYTCLKTKNDFQVGQWVKKEVKGE